MVQRLVLLLFALASLEVPSANGGASDDASQCTARKYGGDARAGEPVAAAADLGLQCPGFAEEEGCCELLPTQRTLAWLQQSVGHNSEQLSSFESLLGGVDTTLLALRAGALNVDADCIPVAEALLQPRVDAARSLARQAREGLAVVEHLIVSALCAYCFHEEAESPFRVTSQDGAAARQLSSMGAVMQATQTRLLADAAELVRSDADRRCIPDYVAGLLDGTVVGSRLGDSLLGADHGEGFGDGGVDLASAQALSTGVEAIGLLRRWPFERRLHVARDGKAEGISLDQRGDASRHFDEEFIEVADRLMAFCMGPAARLAHQTQTMALAFEVPRSAAAEHPVGNLVWGPDPAALASVPAVLPAEMLRAPGAGADEEDPGSAFGVIVLISNRTAADMVNHMLELLEGPRTLFLEDTCGSALEALGYGCHGGGAQQDRCLRPAHATRLAAFTASWDAKRRPHVAWRRHASTRSIAHVAWELASSIWGAHCTAYVMDLRPAEACPENSRVPLSEAISKVPGASLQIVGAPETLLGLDTSPEPLLDPEARAAVDAELSAESREPWRWQTEGDRVTFAERLEAYAAMHQRGVEALAASRAAGEPPPEGVRVLVYVCQSFGQCGGLGDRVNGIATAFMLAILTDRVFLIDSESPLPLQTLLAPNKVDWRVRGNIGALAALRHHSFHDKRRQFEADVGRLATYGDQVLVLSKNYRMLRTLFEAPALRGAAEAVGLPVQAPPFLLADLFDFLFRPAPVLALGLGVLRSWLGDLEDRRFVAIHLRTGDIAWDPGRHGKEELPVFLGCAAMAEAALRDAGLAGDADADPEGLPWLLATDSIAVAEAALELPEAKSGKLRVPGELGRIHVDRSEMGDVLRGTAANYAEWLLFGRAAAVVLSRSFFGETAAEIGRVGHAYFAPGGACVRVELSSS